MLLFGEADVISFAPIVWRGGGGTFGPRNERNYKIISYAVQTQQLLKLKLKLTKLEMKKIFLSNKLKPK